MSDLLDSLFTKDEDGADINEITRKVIGCSYTVSNALGCGFLEKVYENALAHEIVKNNLQVLKQYPINVFYDKVIVGEYIADLLVENSVIVELKAVNSLEDSHLSQCLNYLKAKNLKVCLLINFGRAKIEVKRISL